jgi:hypothetical protein
MCKMDILKYYGFIVRLKNRIEGLKCNQDFKHLQFTGSQESILHLDLEDGNLNSSDSRDTDTPSQVQTHPVRYAEPVEHRVNDNPHSSHVTCPRNVDISIRKPSLVSLVCAYF